MSRWTLAIGVVMALAGCGGGAPKTSPNDLDNACSIVAQRPAYLRAMRTTERRWKVPVPVQMAVIHQESKFDGDARTPYRWVLQVIPMGRQSSAFGYSQALDGTWEEYKRETGNRFHGLVHEQDSPAKRRAPDRRAAAISGLSRGPFGLSPRLLQREGLAGH